jgi:hypothetical protein
VGKGTAKPKAAKLGEKCPASRGRARWTENAPGLRLFPLVRKGASFTVWKDALKKSVCEDRPGAAMK